MTVTTNERGQQNMFAKEPQMYAMEVSVTHNEKQKTQWPCCHAWHYCCSRRLRRYRPDHSRHLVTGRYNITMGSTMDLLCCIELRCGDTRHPI